MIQIGYINILLYGMYIVQHFDSCFMQHNLNKNMIHCVDEHQTGLIRIKCN